MRTRTVAGLAFSISFALANSAIGQGVETKPPNKSAIVAPVAGVTYFNRPGATLAQQRADLETCKDSVLAMQQPAPTSSDVASGAGGYGLTGVLVGVAMEAAMDAQARRAASEAAIPTNYEDCMIIRGWRVLRLDEAAGHELDALAPAQLSTRLEGMAGDSTPSGVVARSFTNEIADQNTDLFLAGPAPRSSSLSLQIVPHDYLELPGRRLRAPMGTISAREATARREERRQYDVNFRAARDALIGRAGRPGPDTKENLLAAIPMDATVIVVRSFGSDFGASPIFVRSDAASSSGVDEILATLPSPQSGFEPQDRTYVYVVPPGRWRLTGFASDTGQIVSLCLGAPAFDVAAGEAVFAGSFGFGGSGRRLDLSLEAPRAALTGAPSVAARLRAASYTNGETFACGGGASYLYAFEVDGAPFREGYAFGSRAASAPVTAPTPTP